MGKKLLKEYFALCDGGICKDFLNEEERKFVKNGGMILTGILQRAGTKNGNGRIYPRNILAREINNYQKLVKERRALGELDHSDEEIVNLKNVSHLIKDMWWDGDTVMGKVEVLNTPSGKTLRSLVESGVTLGISSRGLGSIKETNEGIIVEDDFILLCFDAVSDPSTPGAFLKLQESRISNERQIFSKADRINRLLNDIIKKESK